MAEKEKRMARETSHIGAPNSSIKKDFMHFVTEYIDRDAKNLCAVKKHFYFYWIDTAPKKGIIG